MSQTRPTIERASVAARGISRRFGDAVVLRDAQLVREQPGVVGLVGDNGAGKTTLLRIIAQLVAADAGTLHVGGELVERGDSERARSLVGWAPHEPLAWLDSSVHHNLEYAARLAGCRKAEARTRAVHAAERWRLSERSGEAVRRLSRGWAQRYVLARADLMEPPILLLDEPTTGLDRDARELLDAAVDAWRRERVLVIASHDRAWLDPRCDQLVELAPAQAHA